MKSLVLYTGGHPRNVNDLAHLNEALTETLTDLMKGLISNGATIPNCILYGLQKTDVGGGDIQFSAGAVVLNGEICQFDAQLVVDGTIPNYGVITAVDTYAAGNPITYANGTPRNVHRIRKAHVVNQVGAPTSSQIAYLNDTRFTELLKSNLFAVNSTSWMYPGDPGQPVYQNSFNVSFPWTDKETILRFYKQLTGEVYLRGNVGLDGISTAASLGAISFASPRLMFTMPAGYRPDKGGPIQEVRVHTPDGYATVVFYVYDTGNVSVIGVKDIDAGVTTSSFNATNVTAWINMYWRAV